MWSSKLPELEFHLGSVWCYSIEREGGGTRDEKSGEWEFPTAIYLFTNCVTPMQTPGVLSTMYCHLFQTVTRAYS